MTSILAFVFVLGVLIFVHELGHFLMARRIGVRVLTFSLGFGPKLLAFKRGDTEYCVSAIPLGGYVKMAGENPDDARSGAADEFLSKTKWQRFQVLVMGPVMNLALAFVVLALVLFQGAQIPAYYEEPVVVGEVEESSVANAAGVLPGDRIVSVEGEPVDTWEQFAMFVAGKANREVLLAIDRDGRPVEIRLVPSALGKYELGEVGIKPMIHPQIIALTGDSAAQAAGLRAGDVVLAAAGERNVSRERLVELIKASGGEPILLEIKRNGTTQQVSVTARKVGDTLMIGAQLSAWELRTVEPGLLEAFKMSAVQNWKSATQIVETLGGLLTRETSVKQLMGPVAIADLSGMAAEQGWIPLFSLMAMISLNLGLLNLMPIPVLDGGHIAILALEGVSRREFSMKVKEKMLLAGFALLLMLMVTVIYNDLTRITWLEKLMPWR
ncbi:MAG: RIP metalloprotease RseP [Acidobacteriota bacterium]|nr:RIP metalloprotease RseP [Acidobacteriota bacterium]